ncbi:Phosphoglycerate transport regulatory protein PgtC precursor [Limihaloglobus sulfuriphilus]|uniref:Phosphoglycerate transport regulatory protein PgtC n=1 Tax=Limihaloglobus sulfuriphilus TaxID=1851148 RepID=A0A1Q2MAI9_9BACT|nr:ABC transporter substrate-binding protein [Limihaloglobus sulfuriphilus]AQQ69696.1 Phosphoglycerate transport regulatory protein PgtC precursor [Limihaloglobus sulfuriphilus]
MLSLKNMLLGCAAAAVFVVSVIMTGCGGDSGPEPDNKVVILCPHDENVKYEFKKAFEQWHLEKFSSPATVEWRDVGGGGSTMLNYIRNVYERSDSSMVDILWGAGESPHMYLAEEGLLTKYTPSQGYFDNVPATFSGMRLYDADHLWFGTVVSSFGFIYNKELLEKAGLEEPSSWKDIGSPEFFDHVVLADPSQSASIAAAYEMVVQSEDTWQKGWAKLLAVLGNAKKFTASSGAAVNAPVLGEAIAAACIDYYGMIRVSRTPDILGYVSPEGGTGFTPDPISILKNPAHPQTARRFVDFVLSIEGQRLWALPAGHEFGPELNCLNRPPVRKDFYTAYGQDIPKWIVRPYEMGTTLEIDEQLRIERYDVLVQLVRAAAVNNAPLLKDAKKKIVETGSKELEELFVKLPDNADTLDEVRGLHEAMQDDTFRDKVINEWVSFFSDKYKAIIDAK